MYIGLPSKPTSWASLFGCAAATALINGATAAGGRPRALAISFGVRPRCRSSRTRSINSGFVIVDIVSRTVVRDKYDGGNGVRPDAGAGRPGGIAAGQCRDPA